MKFLDYSANKERIILSLYITIIILLLCCLHHLPHFFITEFSGLGDPTNQDLALRILAAKQWKEGKIPLLNPYNFYGDSIAGKTHTGVFYPPNLLYIFFSPIKAKIISTILHYFILATGMYLFLKSLNLNTNAALLSSLLLSTNPIGFHYVLSSFNTYCWMPWIFFYINKILYTDYKSSYIILMAVIISLSFLSGYPQIFFYIIIIAGAYFIIHAIIAKKISFKIIKFILIISIVFLILSSLQFLVSYEEFLFSARSANNICKISQKSAPTTFVSLKLAYNYFFISKPIDKIIYLISGFSLPLYSIGLIILFIFTKNTKTIIAFISICFLISILFIGENPCNFPILKYFRHNEQFFPVLIPFINSLIIAFILDKYIKLNIKILFMSILFMLLIFIIIPNKNINVLTFLELVYNISLFIFIYIYTAKKKNMLFLTIFTLLIGYNSVKGFYIDKSYYNYNWFSNAVETNKFLIKNNIIHKDSIIYSNSFNIKSPYKRFLNGIFKIQNLELNTFDPLISIDSYQFFNQLLYNKININNLRFLGLKYIIFNVTSPNELIDNFYISNLKEINNFKNNTPISFCSVQSTLYYSYHTKEKRYLLAKIEEKNNKVIELNYPLILVCPIEKQKEELTYFLSLKYNKLTIKNFKTRKSLISIKLKIPIFNYNIRAITDNKIISIFYIDVRGRINYIKINIKNNEIYKIKNTIIADKFYKILPTIDSIKNNKLIYFLDREAKIYIYDIKNNKFSLNDKLLFKFMSSFALNNFAHLDLLKAEVTQNPDWKQIFFDENKGFEIWQYNKNVYPEAWFINETKYATEKDFYSLFIKSKIDIDKVAYINNNDFINKFKNFKLNKIIHKQQKEFHKKFIIQNANEAFLVLRNKFNLCWSAYINGNKVPIYKVNGFMQGIKIPKEDYINLELNCNFSNYISNLKNIILTN